MRAHDQDPGDRFNWLGLFRVAGSLLVAAFVACSVDDREVGVASLQPAPGGIGGGIVECALECPEVACPPDDVCRDYADRIDANRCNAAGTCAGPADCVFSWKPAAPDGAGCVCDEGGCRLAVGLACTAPEGCASAFCLASNTGENVCCAVACSAAEACTPDGSGCEPVQACADGDRRCTGSSYQQCSGQQWTTLTECGALGCSNERGGCLRLAGQACEVDADCGEGSCLETSDGARVCCTAACDGECRRCAPTGAECVNLDDDAACGVITCPTDDPCRQYVATVESLRCVDGGCATPEVACTFTAQNANLECNPTTLCDDAGSCSRPKLADNEPCSVGVECLSGACVASEAGGSVCCSSACAPNERCGATGGCVLAPVCTDGDTQCSGSTLQRCNAGQWSVLTECGVLGCDEERGGCLGGAGDTCEADDDCGAGRCLASSTGGSVCCTAACDGACRRCAPTGAACENLPDDDACGDIACPMSTTCRQFPPEVTAGRCIAGRCGSGAQLCVGTPRNAGAVCSPTNRCDTAGNCSLPLLDPGSDCTTNGQCDSNFCVDGTCCSTACDDECLTCGTGVCQAVNTPQCAPEIVECNNADCPIGAQVCCAAFAAFPSCVAASSCPAGSNVPISCDDHLDCDSGTVCCRSIGDGIRVDCVPTGTCNQPPGGFTTFEQLCGSPAQPMTVLQCPSGRTCNMIADSRMIGWSFCQ